MSQRFVADRLWPVLLVLAALIVGAAAVERVAESRETRALVIAIQDSDGAGTDDEGESTQLEGEALAPVDDEHARARVQARRGEIDQAIEVLKRLSTEHPRSFAVQADLGYWLLASGHPREALESLRRAEALSPHDPRILLNIAVAQIRLDDDAGAEATARRALVVDPRYAKVRTVLGSLLARTGRAREAVEVLRPATRIGGNPARANALSALGRAELALGHREQAERAFEQAIERAPAFVELRFAIARAWMRTEREEDTRRALSILQQVVELAPDLPQGYQLLGRAYEALEEPAESEAAYERAVRIDPAYAVARERLIHLALARRDVRRARLHVQVLLDDDANDPHNHFLAGLVASRDGRTEEARAHYRDAIARSEHPSATLWFNLAVLERQADDLPAAIEAYRQAIAIRPEYVAAHNNLGLVLGASAQPAEAEAAFRKALELDPHYAPAWLNLGKFLSSAGRADEAIAALRRASTERDDYPEAQLNLGVAFVRAGKTADAIQVYRSVVQRHPRYASAWFNLGLAYEAGQRVPEAKEAMRQALASSPDHVGALRHLAGLLARGGERQEALATYQDVLDHEPGDFNARLALAELERLAGDRAACEREVQAARAAGAPAEPSNRAHARCKAEP